MGHKYFPVVAAYFDPGKSFDEKLLMGIFQACAGSFILSVDFGAHHPIWGGSYINARRRGLVRLSRSQDLGLLNDGSMVYLRNTKCSSCLDLTFVSKSLYPHVHWLTDLETRGSDHIPTYTSINSFLNQYRRRSVKITDWPSFRTRMESTTAGDLESFG